MKSPQYDLVQEHLADMVQFYGPLWADIMKHLEVESIDQIDGGWDLFVNDPDYDEDEMWLAPAFKSIERELDDYNTLNFSFGHCIFATAPSGERVYLEQNASPFLILRKVK